MKILAEIEVPEDTDFGQLTIVNKVEYEDIKKRADYASWWTFKDVKERYKHDLNWFKEKVFFQEKFKAQLIDCVRFPERQGQSWEFEPNGFSKFMRLNFSDIASE